MSQQPPKGNRYRKVIIQECFRFDAACALFILMEEGERFYPGISGAEVLLWTFGTHHPDGKTWKDYDREGTILIGVGGSPFDEHPNPEFGDGKAKGLSATMLVAQDLGLDESPLYQDLVELVTKQDLGKCPPDPFSLGNLMKLAHRNKQPFQEIINWVFGCLRDFVAKQRRFLEAQRDFREQAEVTETETGKVALVFSDNDEMAPASRAAGIAVLVRVQGNGHVQILTNKKMRLDLSEVVAAIRYHELKARKKDDLADGLSDKALKSPGQLKCVPNWCYQQPGENILNGSETASGLEVTELKPEKIFQLVCKHLKRMGQENRNEVAA